MTPDELRDRTKQFGLRVIRLVQSLPKDRTVTVLSNQLLRSATSVGANYRSSCRARSRAEFISKLGIAEEEADESAYWLELLVEAGIVKPKLIENLLEEANELTAIISASKITAKKRIVKPK